MIYLIALFIIVGAAICGWAFWAGRGPYDADGNMWLVFPMLFGASLILIGLLIAGAWGAWFLLHHLFFR